MAFGLTQTGFLKKRINDIKSDLETSIRSLFGAYVNLLPQSVFAQLIGVFAEREASLWELAEGVYQSQFPESALDSSLDNLVALNGLIRKPASKSYALAQILTGTAGTLVPAGTVFSVLGNSTARFLTQTAVTLSSGGTATVDCIAESTGPVTAVTNTLSVIQTPINGLTTTRNPTDAIVGQNVETNADLRLRRQQTLKIAGAGTLGAIRSKLLNLSGVQDVIIFENSTSVADSSNRPGKSYEVIVGGGLDQSITDVIWASKPVGIQTVGSQSGVAVDSMGFPHTVYYSRPTSVPIYLVISITKTSDFPSTGVSQIQQAISALGNSLGIGKSVILYGTNGLISTLTNIPGIVNAVILMGRAVNPTSSLSITMAANEISVFDPSTITVNVS